VTGCGTVAGRQWAAFGLESQGDAIDAITQAGRAWAVRKDMAEMRVAAVAMHLGPTHEPAVVRLFAHHLGVKRGKEAGPAGAGIEFCLLVEKRRITADAAEGAGILGEIVMGEGALGRVLAGDLVGKVGKLGLPFRFGLDDLVHHGDSCLLPAM
jgi:hypothetical protein